MANNAVAGYQPEEKLLSHNLDSISHASTLECRAQLHNSQAASKWKLVRPNS